MKKYILILIFLFISQLAISQESDSTARATRNERTIAVPDGTNDKYDPIYSQEDVDKEAYYPGGMKRFYAFVDKTFKVPEGESFNGKIILSFIVENDGSVSNIKVVRNTGYGSPEEAVAMMSKSPKWIPAKLKGKNVRSTFELPLTFASKK